MNSTSDNDCIFPPTYYMSQSDQALLCTLIEKKILRILRYTLCDTKEEYEEYISDLIEKRQIPHSHVFSLIEGPVLFEFESQEEVLFFAEESMQSIAFSFERDSCGNYKNECKYYTPKDLTDEIYIDIHNKIYSENTLWECLDTSILDIQLYRRKGLSFSDSHRVHDHVIVFKFDGDKSLALIYGIDPGTDMMIVSWDSLSDEIRNEYYEVLSLKKMCSCLVVHGLFTRAAQYQKGNYSSNCVS